MRDMRVGAMFYYRTNRDQLGIRNVARADERVYAVHGDRAERSESGPTTVTVYNLAPSLASAQNNIRDNEPYLDTDYKGIEFTASKRFSNRWQMVAGLTHRQERGRTRPGHRSERSERDALPDGHHRQRLRRSASGCRAAI